MPADALTVWEYLLLFHLAPELEPQRGVAAVEAVWGLQFLLPGCVCAFGGPVMQDAAFRYSSGATHALHMRFSGRQQADAFRAHPVVQAAFAQEVAPVASDVTELLFEAEVERDIAGVFRKGPEWETGLEHLLLLREPERGSSYGGGGGSAVTGEFARRLAVLARDSRSEALQASAGPVVIASGETAAGAGWAVMARFPTNQQLRWFVESPPYQALLAADLRLPASVALAATCELLPAEQQQDRPAPLRVTDQ